MRISRLSVAFGLAALLVGCGHSGRNVPIEPAREPERRVTADKVERSGGVRISSRPEKRPDRTPPVVMTEVADLPSPIINDSLPTLPKSDDQSFAIATIPELGPVASVDTLPDIVQGPQSGQMVQDGTVFVGNMPESNNALFATFIDTQARTTRGKDVTPRFEWQDAKEFCEGLSHGGHDDWALPNKEQADLIFQNRDLGYLAGSFHESSTAQDPGFYWLSDSGDGLDTEDGTVDGSAYAMSYRFSDGLSVWSLKERDHQQDTRARARCVRLG